MSFCYLHNQSSSIHADALLSNFNDSVSFDINDIQTLDDYDMYMIEIDSVDKDLSLKLNSLFKEKDDPLIYFIIPKKYTLMLFQLMFLLGTKAIFTQNQETDKIISKINSYKDEHVNSVFEKNLGKASIATHALMSYKGNELVHVSEKLLSEFNCDTLEMFENNVCSNIEIKKLLQADTTLELSIRNQNGPAEYKLESISINSNEKVIYFEINSGNLEVYDNISSRVTFMEVLKEKLMFGNRRLSAITISMGDMQKLKNHLSIVEVEDYFHDLLYFMDSLLEDRLIFSQLERDFYIVLFEDIVFNEITDMANEFHEQLLEYIANKNFKSLIDVFAVNLENFEFDEILDIFNNIKFKELTYEQNHSDCIEHTSNTQTVISEDSLLEEAFRENTEFKLLNIYKGLVISTPSKIVKKSIDGIYVTFEQLQGVVMNFEKETVLQSKSFLYDIQANIKAIDLKKKVAFLEDFTFLNTNANSRKYARVTTSSKIPIAISFNGNTINGHVLDLSIKSIAISVKYSKKVDDLDQEDVLLVFNIPNIRFDQGYTQLSLSASVAVIIKNKKDDTCKIVCDLDESSNNESIIMEYVYERQKELIIEVKKMAKLI